MSTDLARMGTNAVLALSTGTDALSRLDQWVTAAQQAHALVAPLVDTAFVPDSYRPKLDPRATPEEKSAARAVAVANATAAVLQGISLGLDPLTALQQIYIVYGRPGMYAKMMVALVQAHGHEVWDEDLSDTRAIVCGRRKGSEHIVRIVITMDMARKARWTTNAKYAETPQDMLWARAAGRVCDRIASDVLKGIATVEEVRDTIQAEAVVGSGTRTVSPRRRPEVAPAAIGAAADPEPPLEDEAEVVEEPAEESITDPQMRKMQALFRDAGIADRADRLAYVSQRVRREVASAKDLTKAEAVMVINALEAPPEPELDEPTPLDAGEWPETPDIEP